MCSGSTHFSLLSLCCLPSPLILLLTSESSTFDSVSSKKDVRDKLQATYSDINDVDAWVGGLAEDHVYGLHAVSQSHELGACILACTCSVLVTSCRVAGHMATHALGVCFLLVPCCMMSCMRYTAAWAAPWVP